MSSPEIIALHGNLGSPLDWEELGIPRLSAIDLWEWSELSYFEFAHELATNLSEGKEKPILAGYSLGGRLALYALAIHPDRWGGAIIASAHPGLPCVEDRLARVTSDRIWAERARDLPWLEFLGLWNAQPIFDGEEDCERSLGLQPRRDSIALAFETWSLGRQEDLRSNLRRFHAPVLWVSGARDRKFTSLAEEMDSVFLDLTREVLPETGHRVLGPDFVSVVMDWLVTPVFSLRA